MPSRTARRHETERQDALLALPLARFRRDIAHLSDGELTTLERRLTLQEVRHRWELGSHGLARHHARSTLALLARRHAELGRERDKRAASAGHQLLLIDPEPGIHPLPRVAEPRDRAA